MRPAPLLIRTKIILVPFRTERQSDSRRYARAERFGTNDDPFRSGNVLPVRAIILVVVQVLPILPYQDDLDAMIRSVRNDSNQYGFLHYTKAKSRTKVNLVREQLSCVGSLFHFFYKKLSSKFTKNKQQFIVIPPLSFG